MKRRAGEQSPLIGLSHGSAKLLNNMLGLAHHIRQARRSQGVTLAELSGRTDIAISTLFNLESGLGSVASLERVCDALGVGITGLTGSGNRVGRRLAESRVKAGWTTADLAREAGLDPKVVANLEASRGHVASLHRVLVPLRRAIRVAPAMVRQVDATVGDRDVRLTHPEVLSRIREALGDVELDPCGHLLSRVGARRQFLPNDDGLSQSWESSGLAFCNPPYSAAKRWAEKARAEHRAGSAPLILLLLKSTTYGSTLSDVLAEAHTWFLRDRLRFLGPDGLEMGVRRMPFGSALFLLGGGDREVEAVSRVFAARYLPPDR